MLSLSQGGRTGPGIAGGMRLYDAVRLASHQPAQPISATLSRLEPEYFAFTKSGGYLAGPASTRSDLNAPRGAVTLAVPQGTVVVQARDQSAIGAAQYQNSHARFFVLRDHLDVGEIGQLRHVTASKQDGISTLNLAFSPRGQRSFRRLTAGIARRGASLAESADPVLQHIAIIDDGDAPQRREDRLPRAPRRNRPGHHRHSYGSPNLDESARRTGAHTRHPAPRVRSDRPLA